MKMYVSVARHCRDATPGCSLWTLCGLKSAGRIVLSPAVFDASEADLRCDLCAAQRKLIVDNAHR